MALMFVVLSAALLAVVSCQDGPGGYSYNRFSGPVSGNIQQIKVQAGEGAATQYADFGYDHKTGQINPETQKYAHYKTVDYVAKPDYQYAYGVEDPHTGNTQNHKETRDGDVVRGEYSLVEADGSIRRVKYTADSKNGFVATVHNEPAGSGGNQQQEEPHQQKYQQQRAPQTFNNNNNNNQNNYNNYDNNYDNNYNDNYNNNNYNNNNNNRRNNYNTYEDEADY